MPYWRSGRGGFRCLIISGILFCPARTGGRIRPRSCTVFTKMPVRPKNCVTCSSRWSRAARGTLITELLRRGCTRIMSQASGWSRI